MALETTARFTEVPTREALLRAGRHVFARRGYDGASIRAITREAHANLGSVTYHFGSKKALYEAVLARVLGPIGEQVRARGVEPGDAIDRTGDIVRLFFAYLRENPDLPQLMLQEVAAGKPPPPPVTEVLGAVIGTLGAVVRTGQEGGDVRSGDPHLMGLSCVVQAIHLTLVRHWLAHIRGTSSDDPEEHDRLVAHAVAFARAALRTHSSDAAQWVEPEADS